MPNFFCNSQTSGVLALNPPVVLELLPDVEGGQINLLPVAALARDVRVLIPQWTNASPHPDKFDEVELIWKGGKVDSLKVTGETSDAERTLLIPRAELIHGVHTLCYRFKAWNEIDFTGAPPIDVTVDGEAPQLATDSTLIFPPEVIPPNNLTAAYLADPTNNDQVLATIPDYSEKKVGDVITWYWASSDTDFEVVGTLTLELDDITGALPQLTFTGDMIRNSRNGIRFAYYQIEDRAGNVSLASERIELLIQADPTPRTLPWPLILNANTQQDQTLDPTLSQGYFAVEIPETADVDPVVDKLWVQWGAPGQVGAGRYDVPLSNNPLMFEISMPSVAAFLGEELKVYYGIEGIDDTSQETNLHVLKIPSGMYPPIQCEGASVTGLSYKDIKDDGAALTLSRWMMMTTDQVVRIKVTGVSANSPIPVEERLPDYSVTESDLTAGIGANRTIRVDKEFFNQLKRSENFMIHVSVSFDQGATWPTTENFPYADITLVD
ncbi:hypothetical protein SB766_01575 [Pseudomonas sp. SIMBA_077]